MNDYDQKRFEARRWFQDNRFTTLGELLKYAKTNQSADPVFEIHTGRDIIHLQTFHCTYDQLLSVKGMGNLSVKYYGSTCEEIDCFIILTNEPEEYFDIRSFGLNSFATPKERRP